MIEQALQALLAADAAVSALAGTRVYPNKLPQTGATFPQVTYHRVSDARGRHLLGPDGVPAARVQVDCWGLTYADAKTLADLVRKAVEGTAALPVRYPRQWGPWVVRRAWVEDDRDDYFPPVHADDVGTHRCVAELVIFYEEQ